MGKNMNRMNKTKVVNFNPTGEYYFTKGIKAFQRRDLYKAKKYLNRAFQLEPDEPMIACQLAMICTELGEYQYSNQLLENILQELDPFMTECHYFLANNFAHMGLFKEAFKHANEYLDKDEFGEYSEDAEDLLDLITFETDETEETLEFQDDLLMRQEKARELLEAGHFVKAVEQLEEMIELYPEFWSAYNNLALAYFYVGNVDEAFDTLNRVLEKNPGNLHALCNGMVFYHYQMNEEKIHEVYSVLKKVRPFLEEHRLKLGATFALTGYYEDAYQWLRLLQKHGHEGDGTFYYWLSKSAYQIGKEKVAQQAWAKVIEYSPDKEGLEPWGNQLAEENGFESHMPSIIKKLESEYPEERLFGLFLASKSSSLSTIQTQGVYSHNKKFGLYEQQYKKSIELSDVYTFFAGEVAEILYQVYQPVQMLESGLYLLWFSVYIEGKETGIRFGNPIAWAAAIDYEWHKLRDEKNTQKEVANRYDISVSTLGKYVKLVAELLS